MGTLVTSHATEFDGRGRPLAPSAGFRPHPDIEYLAATWLVRHRADKIENTHMWIEAGGREVSVQAVLDCVTCGRGIFILSPDVDRPGYQVNTMQIRAAIVSHLHAHHEGILHGPRRDTGTGWPPPPAPGSDNARTGSNSGSGAGADHRPADQAGHHLSDGDGAASAG